MLAVRNSERQRIDDDLFHIMTYDLIDCSVHGGIKKSLQYLHVLCKRHSDSLSYK